MPTVISGGEDKVREAVKADFGSKDVAIPQIMESEVETHVKKSLDRYRNQWSLSKDLYEFLVGKFIKELVPHIGDKSNPALEDGTQAAVMRLMVLSDGTRSADGLFPAMMVTLEDSAQKFFESRDLLDALEHTKKVHTCMLTHCNEFAMVLTHIYAVFEGLHSMLEDDTPGMDPKKRLMMRDRLLGAMEYLGKTTPVLLEKIASPMMEHAKETKKMALVDEKGDGPDRIIVSDMVDPSEEE